MYLLRAKRTVLQSVKFSGYLDKNERGQSFCLHLLRMRGPILTFRLVLSRVS